MLYYHRIDTSEGINVKKASETKECNICHYRYTLNKRFKFQTDVCYGCHDVLVMSINLSNTAFLIIYGADYRCIFSGISKSEAINVMQNIDLSEKSGTL